jgi:hypothetical protein
MKLLPLLCLILTSCSPIWGELGKDVEAIETDEAVKVIVDKEAMQKDTDIEITVKITNKDAAPEIHLHPMPNPSL